MIQNCDIDWLCPTLNLFPDTVSTTPKNVFKENKDDDGSGCGYSFLPLYLSFGSLLSFKLVPTCTLKTNKQITQVYALM